MTATMANQARHARTRASCSSSMVESISFSARRSPGPRNRWSLPEFLLSVQRFILPSKSLLHLNSLPVCFLSTF